MSSSSLKKFCKTAACPSSEALLNYRRHQLPLSDRAAIEIHLRGCDFCSAELQLLKRYRIAERAPYRLAEMPFDFRRLAEELLRDSARKFLSASDLTEAQRLSH